MTYCPLRRLGDFSPQVTRNLNDRDASVKVCYTSTLGPNLGLKDIDFGRSPSHVGAIRVNGTRMRFSLTRAPAQPLAWQVGQNAAVTGITTLECSLGDTIVGLVLEELKFSQQWAVRGEQLTTTVPTSQES